MFMISLMKTPSKVISGCVCIWMMCVYVYDGGPKCLLVNNWFVWLKEYLTKVDKYISFTSQIASEAMRV